MTTGATNLPSPGDHGGDGLAVARFLGIDSSHLLDLSASLNPFAPDVAALAASHLGALRNYPDAAAATEELAGAMGVDPELLVLTNGGAEAIALLGQILKEAEIVEPEFSLYRRHLARTDLGSAGRWRSNPSNPLGQLAASSEIAAVWDEAFYPMATGEWSRGDTKSWRLGSLTKLWACAGLRLGYVIAPSIDQAVRLRATAPMWSVNGLALSLVSELLDQTDLAGWAKKMAELRTEFTRELSDLGFEVQETKVNWVLIRQPDLRADLIPRGVLIRDCANFGLPQTYRVALPRPSELERALEAFAQVAPAVASEAVPTGQQPRGQEACPCRE